jgi:hypothetical protein
MSSKSKSERVARVRVAFASALTLCIGTLQAFAQSPAPAPFAGLPAEDYLNAVYSGNFDRVREADVKYLKGYLDMSQRVAQELNSMGLPGGVADGLDSSHFSMVTPVLAVYLLNYGQTSKKCLRPGFKEFVVNTTLIETSSSPWGGEIVRDLGIVNVSRYPVNREFIPAFSEIGTSNPYGGSFDDAFMNDGWTTSVYDGVRTMMARIPCNDARIVRFEKNLLSLYVNREANRQRVLANREKANLEHLVAAAKPMVECQAEARKLGLEAPYFFEFSKRCESDRSSITAADIERWKNGPKEYQRLWSIIYSPENPRFTKAGTYIRQQHCASLERSTGGLNQLSSMQCILDYQPTEAELKTIKMMDEMKIRRGEKP